jgi:hypothetical protein
LLLLAAVGMVVGPGDGQPNEISQSEETRALQIADFAGRWSLAPDLSKNLEGPMAHARLLLSIDSQGEVAVTIQPPEMKHNLKLDPDGVEVDFVPGFLPPPHFGPPRDGGAPPPPPTMFPPVGRRSVTWGEDRKSMIVQERLKLPVPDGGLELKRRSVWSLNLDKSLLTWNVEQDTPRGLERSIQVFRRES